MSANAYPANPLDTELYGGSELVPQARARGAWDGVVLPYVPAPLGGDVVGLPLSREYDTSIDPVTYQVRVDRYVSMHDAGKILNPLIAEGQMRGAFAQGIAAALYEEFVTNEEGAFLTGTFADYLVPTVSEIPPVELLHIESPSPFTPLGAKGLAEGNCMSVPACIANAIADALGVKNVQLPATPRRIHALMAQNGGVR